MTVAQSPGVTGRGTGGPAQRHCHQQKDQQGDCQFPHEKTRHVLCSIHRGRMVLFTCNVKLFHLFRILALLLTRCLLKRKLKHAFVHEKVSIDTGHISQGDDRGPFQVAEKGVLSLSQELWRAREVDVFFCFTRKEPPG